MEQVTTFSLHAGPVWVDLLLRWYTENFRFKVTDLNTDVVLVNENLDDGINTGMSVGTLTSIVDAKTGLGCTYKEVTEQLFLVFIRTNS